MPAGARFTWKGPREIVFQKCAWNITTEEVTCALFYKGPYDLCLSRMPRLGDTVQGYTDKFQLRVHGITIEKSQEADKAEMQVTLHNPFPKPSDVSTPVSGPAGDAIPQLHWQPRSVAIERHPKCGKIKDESKLKDGHIPDEASYVPVAKGWSWDDYTGLLKAGFTEYDEPQPVIMLSSGHYDKPEKFGDANFRYEEPDAGKDLVVPKGYKWLRGGDELTRQDRTWRWTRTWTGTRVIGTSREDQMILLYANW